MQSITSRYGSFNFEHSAKEVWKSRIVLDCVKDAAENYRENRKRMPVLVYLGQKKDSESALQALAKTLPSEAVAEVAAGDDFFRRETGDELLVQILSQAREEEKTGRKKSTTSSAEKAATAKMAAAFMTEDFLEGFITLPDKVKRDFERIQRKAHKVLMVRKTVVVASGKKDGSSGEVVVGDPDQRQMVCLADHVDPDEQALMGLPWGWGGSGQLAPMYPRPYGGGMGPMGMGAMDPAMYGYGYYNPYSPPQLYHDPALWGGGGCTEQTRFPWGAAQGGKKKRPPGKRNKRGNQSWTGPQQHQWGQWDAGMPPMGGLFPQGFPPSWPGMLNPPMLGPGIPAPPGWVPGQPFFPPFPGQQGDEDGPSGGSDAEEGSGERPAYTPLFVTRINGGAKGKKGGSEKEQPFVPNDARFEIPEETGAGAAAQQLSAASSGAHGGFLAVISSTQIKKKKKNQKVVERYRQAARARQAAAAREAEERNQQRQTLLNMEQTLLLQDEGLLLDDQGAAIDADGRAALPLGMEGVTDPFSKVGGAAADGGARSRERVDVTHTGRVDDDGIGLWTFGLQRPGWPGRHKRSADGGPEVSLPEPEQPEDLRLLATRLYIIDEKASFLHQFWTKFVKEELPGGGAASGEDLVSGGHRGNNNRFAALPLKNDLSLGFLMASNLVVDAVRDVRDKYLLDSDFPSGHIGFLLDIPAGPGLAEGSEAEEEAIQSIGLPLRAVHKMPTKEQLKKFPVRARAVKRRYFKDEREREVSEIEEDSDPEDAEEEEDAKEVAEADRNYERDFPRFIASLAQMNEALVFVLEKLQLARTNEGSRDEVFQYWIQVGAGFFSSYNPPLGSICSTVQFCWVYPFDKKCSLLHRRRSRRQNEFNVKDVDDLLSLHLQDNRGPRFPFDHRQYDPTYPYHSDMEDPAAWKVQIIATPQERNDPTSPMPAIFEVDGTHSHEARVKEFFSDGLLERREVVTGGAAAFVCWSS